MMIRGKRLKQDPQGTLTVKEVNVDDAGQYTCLNRHGEAVAIYQLDIKIRERRKTVGAMQNTDYRIFIV